MSDIETIRYDLNMWQGATFALTVAVKSAANGLSNVNLTGCSARMQLREQYDSNTAAETLSSSNGEIIFDTANGVMSIELDADRTANIQVDLTSTSKPPKTIYVYDLNLTDANNRVTKLIYGVVNVYGDVTR